VTQEGSQLASRDCPETQVLTVRKVLLDLLAEEVLLVHKVLKATLLTLGTVPRVMWVLLEREAFVAQMACLEGAGTTVSLVSPVLRAIPETKEGEDGLEYPGYRVPKDFRENQEPMDSQDRTVCRAP